MALNKLTTKMTEQEARATQNQNNLHLLASEGTVNEQTIFDELAKKTAESSGAELIGVSPIDGIEGDNAQAVLGAINTQLSQKAPLTALSAAISAHNSDTAAHSDIRTKIDSDISAHNTNGEAHKNIQKNMSDLATEKANAALTAAKEYADIKANDGYSEAKTYTDSAVSAHNTSGEAHGDIRDKISLLQKYPSYEYATSGGAVQRFDDVSLIPHTIGVTVHGATKYSRNMLLLKSTSAKGYTTDISTIRIVNPTTASYVNSVQKFYDDITLEAGTYTLSVRTVGEIELASGSYFQIMAKIGDTSINPAVSLTSTKSKTFTVDESGTFSFMGVSIGAVPTSADLELQIQLEKGSTATAYEPYYEPKSVTNPTVSVYGKNLSFWQNVASKNGYTFNNSHCDVLNPTTAYNAVSGANYTKISSGTYTISVNIIGNVVYGSNDKKMLIYYKLNGENKYLAMRNENDVNVKLKSTFTIDSQSDIAIERVWFPTTPTSADLSIDVQLEVGSTATEYEPYTEPQTANPSITIGEGEVFKVETFNAVSPTMTVVATDDNALVSVVDVTYNRDVGKVLGNLQAAIAALV